MRGFTICVCCFALAAAGCADGGSPHETAHVQGQVTLDGAPLEQGNLNLVPTGGGQARPSGATITAGKFEIAEAPLGKVRAYIISTKETGKMITGSSQPVPEVINVIPPQYQQGIEIEITGDNDALNFELTKAGGTQP